MDANELIRLYKHPHHHGLVEDATHRCHVENPLCGDGMTVSMRIKDGRIDAIGFEGDSCSVSVATSSLLGDLLAGVSVDDALTLSGDRAVSLTGVPAHRRRCALLPLKAVLDALGPERPWDQL